MTEFEDCIKQGRIVQVEIDEDWMRKEFEEANYDLSKASESIEHKDFKWAIVQGYYSMFHAAKALVLSAGYREKSHNCLIIALRELFIEKKKLEREYSNYIEEAMDLRHQADYGLEYSEEESGIVVENAGKFVKAAGNLLKY